MDVGDDEVCVRFDDRYTTDEPTESRVDDAALASNGYDDDAVSYECDYDRDRLCDDVDLVCCTRC